MVAQSRSGGGTVCAEIIALIENRKEWGQLIESLSRSGHHVCTFDNYASAVKVLKHKDPVHLIISDVHLQNGGDVFDFLRWVRKDPCRTATPFVMLSMEPTLMAQYLEDGIRISSRLLGATLYITQNKFDSADLIKEIESILPSEAKKVAQPSIGMGE